jgi:hypothetical protein
MKPIADFCWFEGEAMHFDAPRYARLRGIGLDEAVAELQELAAKLLPGTPQQVVGGFTPTPMRRDGKGLEE